MTCNLIVIANSVILQMMTPPQELKSGNPSATDLLVDCEPEMQRMEPDPIPPPTCTPAGTPTRGPTPVEPYNITTVESRDEGGQMREEAVQQSRLVEDNNVPTEKNGAEEAASIEDKPSAPVPEPET